MPANILRSFVKQLAVSPEKDAIHHSLTQIYHQKAESGFNSKELSFEESEAVLGQMIGTYQYATTTLVVDALDECHESLRRELIEAFDRLIDKSTNLKILVSSRRNADIMLVLERKTSVGISATDNQNDISKFVADKIEKNKKDRLTPIKKEVQEQIIETLLAKSEGMKVTPSILIFAHKLLTDPSQVPMGFFADRPGFEVRANQGHSRTLEKTSKRS